MLSLYLGVDGWIHLAGLLILAALCCGAAWVAGVAAPESLGALHPREPLGFVVWGVGLYIVIEQRYSLREVR